MVRQHHQNSKDMNLGKLQETVKDRRAWHAVVCVVTKSWTQLSDCTTTCAHTQSIASHTWGFLDSSVGKESTCDAGDPVQFLGREDFSWVEKG